MHSAARGNSVPLDIRENRYRELLESPYSVSMSDAGYSVDSQGVKSKIASFEAFNETLRNGGDSPERRSNSGVNPASGANTSMLLHRSTMEDDDDEDEMEFSTKESTTALASQNRKSRLQRTMNGKRQQQPEPGSLMQKRLSARERRLASLHQHPSIQQQHKQMGQQQQQQQQQQQALMRQQSHKEQRQPSSRNGSSRSPKQSSPAPASKTPTSSSSYHSDSNLQSPASNTGKPSSVVASPNMRAQQAANQHRVSHYGSNYNTSSNIKNNNSTNNAHQQQQLKSNGSSGSSESKGKGSLSRFHKLKMKGMDHARLAQKRKQAAQKPNHIQSHGHQPQQDPQHHSRQVSPINSKSRQHSPRQTPPQPALRQQLSPQNMQHQTIKSQDSPDHPLTDDEATLTSVARILDQEQSYVQQRNMAAEDAALSAHPTTPSGESQTGSNAGKPPHLWMGGEEKSDKALEHSPQHHLLQPRPSSSSEFEGENNSRRSNSQNPYSAESNTPSPQQQSRQLYQHQQLRHQQQWQHSQYHHQQYQSTGNTNYYTASYSPSKHNRQQQYSPPHQTSMMMSSSPQDRLRRSGGSYPSNHGAHQPYYQTEDDEKTYDYGVRDDDSQGSTTFQQQLFEAERKAREHNTTATSMSQQSVESSSRHNGRRNRNDPPVLKTDDPMEKYRQSFDSPMLKTAAGVIGAATVGCIMVGPVGMLLGAAAVGIGVGVMQIPEEQRSNMAEKASEAMAKVQEQAFLASETLSASCATTYKDSGIAEHIPAEMSKFCAVSADEVDLENVVIVPDIMSEDSEAVRLDQVPCGGGVGGDLPMLKSQEARKPTSPNQSRSLRNKKVACLRHVRILPVSQIHSLDPAFQPRAWLDVLASADTSGDEKTEAMEEILILAKDKQRARIFLEEGILDSIMWILSRYFEKQNRKPTDEWANPDITFEERNAARLAANCCVTLGKAHCAAIHTEGDLNLMSLYERGSVPEERQLAQMLYEVPHHARVTKTNDPTVVDPSMEVFALKQLTLPQAEDLAKSIKALADGK